LARQVTELDDVNFGKIILLPQVLKIAVGPAILVGVFVDKQGKGRMVI